MDDENMSENDAGLSVWHCYVEFMGIMKSFTRFLE
jgi:hypothetical protein